MEELTKTIRNDVQQPSMHNKNANKKQWNYLSLRCLNYTYENLQTTITLFITSLSIFNDLSSYSQPQLFSNNLPQLQKPKSSNTAKIHVFLCNLSLLNYFRITMKRTRQDHPISLSNKRNSLQTEKFTTPQKNQCIPPPFQTVENTHNKSLYTHMKAELTNIKNDFQRLIQREERNVGLGAKEKQMIELKNGWQTGSKGKTFGNFKSDGGAILFDRTPDIDTFDHLIKNKDVIDPSNKIFSLTKNINQAVNFKNKHVANKDRQASNNPISKYISLNPRDNEVKQANYASLTSKKQSNNGSQFKEKELELARIEIIKQKSIIEHLEKEYTDCKDEKAKINEDYKALKEKYVQLKDEVLLKDQKIMDNSEVIAQYKNKAQTYTIGKDKLRQFEELQSSILQERQQMTNKHHFYNQKINELTFYNSNFYQENMQITEENQMLKDNIIQLQRHIEDSKRINAESEKEYQRKMDYLQKNIAEYQKRERMLETEIQKLYASLDSQSGTVLKSSQQQPHKREGNHSSAEEEIIYLRQQIARQREINELISKKYREQLSKLNIEELTRTFQTSIQALTDENLQLKNRRNALQSKIQELQQKTYCYQSEIALYEQRERESKASRSLSSCEWQEMTEKIERLQTENKRLMEEKDYREISKEVKEQCKKAEVDNEVKEEYNNLLRIVKDQLEEINTLQEKNKQQAENVLHCKEEIQAQRAKRLHLQDQLKTISQSHTDASLSDLLTKHQHLSTQLQQKVQKISHLKKFFLSLIQRKQLQYPSEQQQKYYLNAVTTLAKI